MYVDSHAHLEGKRFDADRDAVIARAREAGVETMLTVGQVGASWDSMMASLQLAERFPFVWTSVGLHPHDARHFDDEVGRRMLDLAHRPRVVAWGECGLDFYYDNSPRDRQLEAFRAQLLLAREVGLPVIVHSRDAADETLEVLRETKTGAGVFHCFSYDLRVAREAIALGLYVSFSGIVTFPSAEPIREAAATIPLGSMLIETDCPFLAPVPHRGKRNEPAFVTETAAEIARLRGTAVGDVAGATAANFRRLFFGSAE